MADRDDRPGAPRAYALPELARLTGLSEEALRSRCRRGTLAGARGNDGGWRVTLTPEGLEGLKRGAADRSVGQWPAGRSAGRPVEETDRLRKELAEARERAEGLAERAHAAERRADRAEGRAEGLREALARQDARVETLEAELAELRRPWPARWWRALRSP